MYNALSVPIYKSVCTQRGVQWTHRYSSLHLDLGPSYSLLHSTLAQIFHLGLSLVMLLLCLLPATLLHKLPHKEDSSLHTEHLAFPQEYTWVNPWQWHIEGVQKLWSQYFRIWTFSWEKDEVNSLKYLVYFFWLFSQQTLCGTEHCKLVRGRDLQEPTASPFLILPNTELNQLRRWQWHSFPPPSIECLVIASFWNE